MAFTCETFLPSKNQFCTRAATLVLFVHDPDTNLWDYRLACPYCTGIHKRNGDTLATLSLGHLITFTPEEL